MSRKNHNQGMSTVLTDEEFERFRNGDRKIFKKVFDHYVGLVHYVVKRCGIDDELSHDLVQDTFLKLYAIMGEIHSAQSIKSWLVTTSRNQCLDILRKKKTERKYLEQPDLITISQTTQSEGLGAGNSNLVSEQELHELELQLLSGLIQKFESRLRDKTFSAFYCDGLSAKQIAEQNNEPISSVTNRLSRYRKQFKLLFAEHINALRDSIY